MRDIDALCSYLKVGKDGVHHHNDELPRIKHGNKYVRYRKKDIDEWLDKGWIPGVRRENKAPK